MVGQARSYVVTCHPMHNIVVTDDGRGFFRLVGVTVLHVSAPAAGTSFILHGYPFCIPTTNRKTVINFHNLPHFNLVIFSPLSI